ncbi:MAG TPA: DUF1365 domain-containing protein [Solirubrobacteraceae bacterium]
MTASAIYSGTIRHRRLAPRSEFIHRVSLAYVDLDELPSLLGGRLLRRGPGTLRFRRRDYLGPAAVALEPAVRDRVAELSGHRPAGPVRLLTQLRSFGLCFNPVSFYYCFDRERERGGEILHSVLAEVTNTPWGERHSYLLSDRTAGSAVLRGRFDKELHVSPFMGMDHVYEARAGRPGPTLAVHIESRRDGELAFDATLALRREPLSRSGVARMTARHPLATARVLALIYGHALALKLRGAHVHPHPGAPAR